MTIARLVENHSTTILSCTAATTVHEAVTMLAQRRIGALPVLAEGNIVAGIFSERDVLYQLQAKGAAMLDLTVGDVMTSPPISVSPSTTALEALALMTRRRIRHLPVIDHGKMIGFVSIGDLVKYRIEYIEAEAEAMRSYIQMP